ncbi:hypothetical protein ON010_g14438 [Phytophthora cinnamomi]|nr:hypothetical protein ON010_g14438 [Phytophthora cinnamomi]
MRGDGGTNEGEAALKLDKSLVSMARSGGMEVWACEPTIMDTGVHLRLHSFSSGRFDLAFAQEGCVQELPPDSQHGSHQLWPKDNGGVVENALRRAVILVFSSWRTRECSQHVGGRRPGVQKPSSARSWSASAPPWAASA